MWSPLMAGPNSDAGVLKAVFGEDFWAGLVDGTLRGEMSFFFRFFLAGEGEEALLEVCLLAKLPLGEEEEEEAALGEEAGFLGIAAFLGVVEAFLGLLLLPLLLLFPL